MLAWRPAAGPGDDAVESSTEVFEAVQRALHSGDWETAHALLTSLCQQEESPEALEGLARVARWRNDQATAFGCAERAYALYRARGDTLGAARAAFRLAEDVMEWRGEPAVAKGWLGRARRILQGHERTEEYALLLFYEGNLALMERNDVGVAAAHGREVAERGRAFRSMDLEMTGVALEGLARVSGGEVEEGMALLDEAATAAIAGDIQDPELRGTACCFVIDACSRVRDFDRGAQWVSHMRRLSEQLHMEPFFAVCRPNYAQVLMWRGLWSEAESELLQAARELQAFRAPMAVEAIVRLAELRCCQGRLDESLELFSRVANEPLAQLGRALVALDMNDPATAIEYCDRYLRRMPPEACAELAAGLELRVSCLLRLGDVDEAERSARHLAVLANEVGTAPFLAGAEFAAGCVAAGRGDLAAARASLEDAADRYAKNGGVYDAARAGVELATVLARQGRTAAARAEASSALETLARIGATRIQERAERLLSELESRSDASPSAGTAPGPLTPREAEILSLMARGLSNTQIAEDLVLSVRTVERHVSNIYGRLGLAGTGARVAAVAWAHQAGAVTGDT